jgi:hypothetical protein
LREDKVLKDFNATVFVAAPQIEVWRSLVDWKSQGEWMALTRVTASDNGADDSGVGTTIDAFTGIGVLGILDRMKVTDWEPPTFCRVEHYGKVIRGIGEFRLTEVAGGTRFDWYEEIKAPKLVLLLIKPFILITVKLSLRKFARSFK